jgi:hypothetical protein
MYDTNQQVYFDKRLGHNVKAYCVADVDPIQDKAYEFPYPQPWQNYTSLITRDVWDPMLESDMFYFPKEVHNISDQIDKWWNVWIWQFVPFFDLIIFSTDFITWSIDYINISFDGQNEKVWYYPLMYENSLAKSALHPKKGEVWGPFRYHDLFSWTGLSLYYWDRFLITWLTPYELIHGISRWVLDDWDYQDIQN